MTDMELIIQRAKLLSEKYPDKSFTFWDIMCQLAYENDPTGDKMTALLNEIYPIKGILND